MAESRLNCVRFVSICIPSSVDFRSVRVSCTGFNTFVYSFVTVDPNGGTVLSLP